jgi:SAM-dependent methyltransferase
MSATIIPEIEPWLAVIDPDTMRGLEIGPLDKPRLTKDRFRVQYVDHAPLEELRVKYADDAAMADHLDEIVDVDFVWTGDSSLNEVVGDEPPFDFVFASHVVEHAPDMIGWLGQIGAVLRDGGLLCLAIPDKRLCFDVNRPLTEIGDLVDAHLQSLRSPSYRQIWDFHSKIVDVDAAALWAGTADYSGTWRTDLDPDHWAYELCLRHQRTGDYIDGHCQVFTPASFLAVYAKLVKLDLIDFQIATFHPSVRGTIEFRVVFEKVSPLLSADERRAQQRASIPSFTETVPEPPAHASPAPESVAIAPFLVTAREEALVRRKRQVVEAVRGLVPSRRRP